MTDASIETAEPAGQDTKRVTLVTLTGMVVGSMVGAGVFALPRRFATLADEPATAVALVAILAVSVLVDFTWKRRRREPS